MGRCGTAAHQVQDTLLVTDSLMHHHPANQQGYITSQELEDADRWLVMEPLLSALQDGRTTPKHTWSGLTFK